MPVAVFYRGGFRWDNNKGDPRTVEWDGVNEQDICDWLNADIAVFIATNSIPVENWIPWVATIYEGVATFTGWRGAAFNPNAVASVMVGQGGWLSAWEWTKGAQSIDSAGMWKTTDPHGRPDDVTKLFAPGTTLPWES